MKIKLLVIGFVVALFSQVVNAETAKVDYTEVVGVQEELEVIYVDHEKRWARLKDKNGFARKIDVSDNVENFDQVEVSDIVTLSYAESINVRGYDENVNLRAYAPDMVAEENMVKATFGETEKGEKPGKFVASSVILVATIDAIDLANNTVTLKDAEGNTEVFPTRYPENLKKIKVGYKVIISHTEAVAINVTGKKASE